MREASQSDEAAHVRMLKHELIERVSSQRDGLQVEYVNDEDHPSYDEWLPDLMPGDVADHDLLPIVADDGGDA